MLTSCTAGVLPPADDLIRFPWGIEKNAARKLIQSGALRAVKLGRSWYCRRSDLLALVDSAPRVAPARASGQSLREDLAAIADRTRRAR